MRPILLLEISSLLSNQPGTLPARTRIQTSNQRVTTVVILRLQIMGRNRWIWINTSKILDIREITPQDLSTHIIISAIFRIWKVKTVCQLQSRISNIYLMEKLKRFLPPPKHPWIKLHPGKIVIQLVSRINMQRIRRSLMNQVGGWLMRMIVPLLIMLRDSIRKTHRRHLSQKYQSQRGK